MHMDLEPTDKRRCARCKIEKVLGESFYRSKSRNAHGWAAYCKDCAKIAAVEWQKKNPEKKKAADHKHYATNPERRRKMRARLDRWAKENPEKAKEMARAHWKRYAAEHPDRLLESQHRYQKTEKYRAACKRGRATEKSKKRHREYMRRDRKRVTYRIREMLRLGRRVYGERELQEIPVLVRGWLTLVEAYGSKCVFCGSAGDAITLEIEHLTPKIRGGVDTVDNLAPACRRCNSSKKSRTIEEFAEYAKRIGSTRWVFDPVAIRGLSEQVAMSNLTAACSGA
jgi:5-methylcytosine-specific restriction endonuclease McrA